MMILTVLGYLVFFLLAWVGGYVFIFTASRALHDGRAQAESQAQIVSFYSVTLVTL